MIYRTLDNLQLENTGRIWALLEAIENNISRDFNCLRNLTNISDVQ